MKTRIGGQAVIEGVMMRGDRSIALSVRDELGQIRVDSQRLPTKKPWYRRVPFLRGVVNLIVSMIDGFKIIGKSAEVMVEDEIDTTEGKGMGGMMFFSMLLGIVLAVALFVFLPTGITAGITKLFPSVDWTGKFVWAKSLIEGVCKMAVLIGYMGGIAHIKQIKRVFMYHGAEHKTIACYEAEMPLTVENVQKCSRYHDRCGTSFLVFVVVLSVILMMVFDIICAFVGAMSFFLESKNWWMRALLKVGLLPITAGFSYEMLMLLARTNFVLFRPLKWLGKQFQKLTTREPDDSMCEVAINSFNIVLQMDADETIPEQHFPEPLTLEQFRQEVENSGVAQYAGGVDDWLVCEILHIKPEHLQKKLKIPYGWVLRLQKYALRMQNGQPWQQVIGSTQFYGRTYLVNKNVLIPRPETELVTEQAIKRLSVKDKVLDLCCGSGIIGTTIALESELPSSVTCADISADALKVAKHNAKVLGAEVNFVQSDMFSALPDKYNIIVCNPPYIESGTIPTLDVSVKNYEPIIALDGGEDGLNFYRILAEQAPAHLVEGGTLVLEIGYNQGQSVSELLQEKFNVEVIKDYSSNDRIVIAVLK